MTNLAQKVTAFFVGTHQEMIHHAVEGPAWIGLYYAELFADVLGSAVFKNTSTDIPKYVCMYLTLDGMTRLGKAIYKGMSGRLTDAELTHPGVPQAGIIGSIRGLYKQ